MKTRRLAIEFKAVSMQSKEQQLFSFITTKCICK